MKDICLSPKTVPRNRPKVYESLRGGKLVKNSEIF